jgi:hypothetical protein
VLAGSAGRARKANSVGSQDRGAHAGNDFNASRVAQQAY